LLADVLLPSPLPYRIDAGVETVFRYGVAIGSRDRTSCPFWPHVATGAASLVLVYLGSALLGDLLEGELLRAGSGEKESQNKSNYHSTCKAPHKNLPRGHIASHLGFPYS
jgi:hypothetical protein